MRIKAFKRLNPYIEEGVDHRPKKSVSPYEKTMQKLFNSRPSLDHITPIELKFCKHCTFNIKLSSNCNSVPSSSYPKASALCTACSSDICEVCTRNCERCERLICFVCSSTLFEENSTYTVCPECK